MLWNLPIRLFKITFLTFLFVVPPFFTSADKTTDPFWPLGGSRTQQWHKKKLKWGTFCWPAAMCTLLCVDCCHLLYKNKVITANEYFHRTLLCKYSLRVQQDCKVWIKCPLCSHPPSPSFSSPLWYLSLMIFLSLFSFLFFFFDISFGLVTLHNFLTS